MACKLMRKDLAAFSFVAGLYCFSASHALYVEQKVATGIVEPSIEVRLLDLAGFSFLVLSSFGFLVSFFRSLSSKRTVRHET